MLKTKYYRDMNHNYLIIENTEKSAMGEHQLKMIVRNNIPGLLTVSLRHIDGESFLYYEINSLQTLQAIFDNRKMDKSMTLRLLSGLLKVLQEIKNYLLNDEGLVLKPEFIFLNWEREEIFFVFYPYGNESISDQMKQLLEYLVRVIDHRDEQLTDMVYDLCQLAERRIISVEDLDRHLSEATLAQTEINEWEGGLNEQDIPQEELIVYQAPEEICPNQLDEKKQRWKFLILALISAAGAIFIFFYQEIFHLTTREILLTRILFSVFIVFFLMTGLGFILLIYRLRNTDKEKIPAYSVSPVLNQAESVKPIFDSQPIEYCGDTVFLCDATIENKLYGFGKANKHIIDLAKSPFCIGKLDGSTDFCLKDSSISRMHVKFTNYENIAFMTDLNSTNGTYKNGLRLEPNETVPIEAGDEIRLGKLNFYYR